MTEVLFYHLTESRLEDALPGLLERSLAKGWRVVVQFASEERRDALDHHLWVYKDESFLPHGSDADGSGALQPILLTVEAGQEGNDPHVRFLVEGAAPAALERYVRAVYLFDGHDEDQIGRARERWTVEKAAGHDVTYWQQTDGGRWVKKV
ncbi:DNA polymerase III subunit chi [Aurantimonas sp. C2-6-R+9]|uniref:DNA polymerase III subunit chi n=1 Tax=unclassified Aurantimonas TaxID=2638230 RepID=UPI002E19FEAE|nr:MULTISPECIES: DNA polymerase III subunit chi [unclassified Aurantimonas]MEC5290644.1 DNA polymerase III subunit chi [Aurantimonas sp. C2-3-R2]MEC5380642.1 DNA polymerase III subunit chi [Aurantimonas sp. C2-6-R+9]MEC5411688.1 DNA polymerase III subunit chi [Aurantimonas sp. C2-4-R8]